MHGSTSPETCLISGEPLGYQAGYSTTHKDNVKFSRQITASLFQIHDYSGDRVTVTVPNQQREDSTTTGGQLVLTDGFVISPTDLQRQWRPERIEDLSSEDVAQLIENFDSELIILGSGQKIVFPDPALLAPLYEARIGVEIMSSDAACRTFNVLCEEGRQVTAAIMLER